MNTLTPQRLHEIEQSSRAALGKYLTAVEFSEFQEGCQPSDIAELCRLARIGMEVEARTAQADLARFPLLTMVENLLKPFHYTASCRVVNPQTPGLDEGCEFARTRKPPIIVYSDSYIHQYLAVGVAREQLFTLDQVQNGELGFPLSIAMDEEVLNEVFRQIAVLISILLERVASLIDHDGWVETQKKQLVIPPEFVSAGRQRYEVSAHYSYGSSGGPPYASLAEALGHVVGGIKQAVRTGEPTEIRVQFYIHDDEGEIVASERILSAMVNHHDYNERVRLGAEAAREAEINAQG